MWSINVGHLPTPPTDSRRHVLKGKFHTAVAIPMVSSCACFRKKLNELQASRNRHRLFSVNGDPNSFELSDYQKSSPEHEGGKDVNNQGESHSSNGNLSVLLITMIHTRGFESRTLKKLRRYGIAGILSYGLLNTVYYLSTFLFVWFYVVPSPGNMGYFAAAERFLKLMAMVWAGSQVTKLLRAAGALALAPVVDRGLSWFTNKFKFESQGKAFIAIVGFCFGLAFVLFLIVTLLSA